jgi:hypothetical protein
VSPVIEIKDYSWRYLNTTEPALKKVNLTIEEGERYELDITVEPPWPNDSYWGYVRLETGVPEQPTTEVMFWPSFPWRFAP